MKPTVVLSLGGSLVVPDEIDTPYLKKLVAWIKIQTRFWRFIFVVGGGKTCRKYQKALKEITRPRSEILDRMGIYTTRVNARLIQLSLGKLAHREIIKDPTKKIDFNTDVLVASGYKPGRSTDYVAVMLAKQYGAAKVINLSNIDFVYDKDPKKFKNARPIMRATWKDFIKIVGAKWIPGANLPFDPVASKIAEQHGLEVDIVNGKNLNNLQKILDGKLFKGTKIF